MTAHRYLGVGELGEVGHHAHLVDVGVDNLLGGEQLGHAQPAVRQVHRLRGVPAQQTRQFGDGGTFKGLGHERQALM